MLVLVLHHIAGDGWSMAPLARDIVDGVRGAVPGEAPGWAPLPVQYADYAVWQRELLGEETDPDSVLSGRWRTGGRRWRGAGGAGVAVRPAAPGCGQPPRRHGSAQRPAGAARRLVALAREQGVTLFMVLQAALAVLLSRLGAGTDIRRRRSPGAPTRRSTIWSASSSTRWCCAPTCPATRLSPSCWAGCATVTGGLRAIRTCRSSGWWRSWPRPGPWPATRLFQVCSPCRTTPRRTSTCPVCRRHARRRADPRSSTCPSAG